MITVAEKKETIPEILQVEDISENHKHILNERMAEYKRNPDNVIDWEIFKAELLKD